MLHAKILLTVKFALPQHFDRFDREQSLKTIQQLEHVTPKDWLDKFHIPEVALSEC